jgi:hypothetical protein
MMPLTSQRKKLFSNILIIAGVIILVGLSYWGVTAWVHYREDKILKEKQKIIELYESKIDSLKKIDEQLFSKIKYVDYQIDSLKKIKTQIKWKYEKENTIIYDATASEHAVWMDATIFEVKHYNLEGK